MNAPTPLADTHCHLCLDAFRDDLPEVLERARRVGVRRILVPGIDLETSRRAVGLAETHPEILAAVGIHPHHSDGYSAAARSELRRLSESPRVVAIGEIGLDYYRDRSPRPAQRRAFADQLELAGEVDLPVIVHQREAAPEVLELLLPWAASRSNPGVLHAFSGEPAVAREAASAGLFLGLAGPITYPNAAALRSTAGELRHDRVVLETDSPYLTPHPRRGERNEPARLALVADALASVWGQDAEPVRRTAWQNSETLFHWNHGTDNRHLL